MSLGFQAGTVCEFCFILFDFCTDFQSWFAWPVGFDCRTHISFGTVDVRKQRQCVDGKETACTSRKRYEVEDILIHEDYITGSLMNDIALIRLTEDVKFDGMNSSFFHSI